MTAAPAAPELLPDETPAAVPLKTCSKCGQEKDPSDARSFRADRKTGRPFAQCRECENRQNRERDRLHPERAAARKRKWDREHPERKLASDRRYRESCADQKREADRRWREAHADQVKDINRRHSRRKLWESLRQRGISREAKKVFTLPEEIRRLTLRIDRMTRLGVKEMMEESEAAASKFGAPGLRLPVLLKDLLKIRDMRTTELRRCAATVERFERLREGFGAVKVDAKRRAA